MRNNSIGTVYRVKKRVENLGATVYIQERNPLYSMLTLNTVTMSEGSSPMECPKDSMFDIDMKGVAKEMAKTVGELLRDVGEGFSDGINGN